MNNIECVPRLLVSVHGVPVSCVDYAYIFASMQQKIANCEMIPDYICVTNTESMYFARCDPQHMDYIRYSSFSLCDGIGVVIAGWFYGYAIPRRNGPVFMLKCCQYGSQMGWRHFFFGGKDDVAKQLAEKFSADIPGFQVCGYYSPPFRDLSNEEEVEMLRMINDSRADVLWVGLGLPKQERWIARYRDRLNIPWLIGVGAAFDYHTGNAKWAPPFLQRIGLEWLYRLLHEPRMFIRNVRSFNFMFSAIFDALMCRIMFHRRNKEE